MGLGALPVQQLHELLPLDTYYCDVLALLNCLGVVLFP